MTHPWTQQESDDAGDAHLARLLELTTLVVAHRNDHPNDSALDRDLLAVGYHPSEYPLLIAAGAMTRLIVDACQHLALHDCIEGPADVLRRFALDAAAHP